MKKIIIAVVLLLLMALPCSAEGINKPVAIKCEEGVFLSWPMDESKEYTIYRDGKAIKTTRITNYMDAMADGTCEYRINNTPVSVWEGQFLEIPLSVPQPYTYTYPNIKHVAINSNSVAMSIGEIWTIVPIVDGLSVFLAPDGNAIDIYKFGTTVGTKVQTYGYHGGENQKFYIEETDKGYLIKGLQSNLYFSVNEDGKTTLAEKENASYFEFIDCTEEITQETLKAVDVVVPIPPTYGPGDASVGDLDGDGEWEIVLKWDPSNAKDSSHDGASGRVFIDAYELDGTMMWRIDLGVNIRAGAHDTQFLVYDFDRDGRAEVSFRISDGTIDGAGNIIGDGEKDWRNGAGKNLEGPLWVAVFEGSTGKMLAKADFDPQNEGIDTIKSFGDDYGNRSERYNACVAYLDGVTPHLIFQRGYYARTVVAAYTYKNGKIEKVWRFDTKDEPYKAYGSNGNHNISVGDGDGDGCDEIYLGSLTLDNDGSVLWCGFEGHGDAMHLGDFDPDNEGLEFFSVHEAGEFGYTIHDAGTGEKLFDIPGTKDTGRGMIANVGPFNGNYIINVGSGARRINSWGETTEAPDYGNNFRIFWDGDLYEEIMSGTHVVGYNPDGSIADYFDAWPDGYSSINGTKSNPCLSADILGDWREEIICKKIDGTSLRIYTTTIPSDFALPPLMTDHVYRMGIVWQNSSYNQPPHLGYYSTGYGKMKINSVDANINGQEYKLTATPYLSEDTVCVPLDFLCEVSGARMIRNGKEITVSLLGKVITINIGEKAYNVDNEEGTLSSECVLLRNTVMVPLGEFEKMLDLTVEYDDEAGEISVLRTALNFIRTEMDELKEENPFEDDYTVSFSDDTIIVNTTTLVKVIVASYDEGKLIGVKIYKHLGQMDYPVSENDKVFVWDGFNFIKPIIDYVPGGEIVRRLEIQGFTASNEPEANNPAINSFDNDKTTSWSSLGVQNIVYDLSEVYALRRIRVMFFKYDDDRYIPYEVYASKDCENWSLLQTGNSPVKSDEFVEVDTSIDARFVKIVVKGNSFNGWNRISEVEIYGG